MEKSLQIKRISVTFALVTQKRQYMNNYMNIWWWRSSRLKQS